MDANKDGELGFDEFLKFFDAVRVSPSCRDMTPTNTCWRQLTRSFICVAGCP